ncbi:UNKNOWN [Stylonychia lemnae]|uniref:Transmembrane protein n=1 Tax=Stylonychia lemnae TaxID=5949 RepID=A0A077ZWK1_STYLE|nr:UNKNOWN [Stylonychia lemnae]|eukprot:CDW74249.1 UNKNOWN [Stylonychia lemnae]
MANERNSILDLTNESQNNLPQIKILMVTRILRDLKFFWILFIIFILEFGMNFLVQNKAQQIYKFNGVNKLAQLLMIFRNSSTDYQLDNYQCQADGLVIFALIIWLIAVMTFIIVFKNFIIALISEQYESIMNKLIVELFSVKAQIIIQNENEYHISNIQLKCIKYFKEYIIVIKQLNSEVNDAGQRSEIRLQCTIPIKFLKKVMMQKLLH